MNRILLVEDDSTLAIGIEYSLKNEGYEVDVSETILEGKELFEENTYRLVLLDVMLPDGSGYELCKEIREKSNTPIIFLTACDEEVNIVMGLDIGGDDYITKPFRIRELISRIKAVLRRYEEDSYGDILISEDIKMFLLEGKVEKNGEEIFLTPIEYKLLVHFMKNPNQILSRNTILERLWDTSGEFVDDNTLSVYIKRLREKIEDSSSIPKYIKTVRGLGYKWDTDIRRG
ncbi:response regulator transcription factor [Anaerosalibacter massiliensis]|uniref:Response regulator transcription factor n=1 Tax=Anaerosalibacter massiliensis TaxID=1347392 RepID=A0A9X2S702_9FIRM|nr:response regulator transcription factor [Anaerosalibacter massiliensis]MCR2043666.1 response regulator transcription factor [Anaerosalibacter massiliensis]